jgi:hypothetical protein
MANNFNYFDVLANSLSSHNWLEDFPKKFRFTLLYEEFQVKQLDRKTCFKYLNEVEDFYEVNEDLLNKRLRDCDQLITLHFAYIVFHNDPKDENFNSFLLFDTALFINYFNSLLIKKISQEDLINRKLSMEFVNEFNNLRDKVNNSATCIRSLILFLKTLISYSEIGGLTDDLPLNINFSWGNQKELFRNSRGQELFETLIAAIGKKHGDMSFIYRKMKDDGYFNINTQIADFVKYAESKNIKINSRLKNLKELSTKNRNYIYAQEVSQTKSLLNR